MATDWSDEVLVPAANVMGYRLVYEAETWLRRICLAALVLSAGPAWATTLDPRVRTRLEEQSRRHSSRWYLGVDAEEELLWSTTHGQLADLLQLPTVAPQVVHLCDMQGAVLADRLRSIAHVRNALAHHRAISEDSITILQGDLTIVRAAVNRFKKRTLYAESSIFIDDFPDDLADAGAVLTEASASLRHQQLFLSANDDFVFLVRLPVEPFGRFPKVRSLREKLGVAAHLLLCVMANKSGDELQFVMPRLLDSADKVHVVERFVSAAIPAGAWTNRPPELQHPADSCWPRMWFYENRQPDR